MATDQHSSQPSRPRPTLLGREREEARLQGLLESTSDGRGRLVLVSGEAGIGKTTLIEVIARRAIEDGVLMLRGGCYDLTTTPPYGPWTEILRTYPSRQDLPSPPAELSDQDGLEKIDSQEQLFRIVADFLRDIAAVTPVVLILEDLHWSDLPTIELLRYLARQLSLQRILIIASYRDDELTRSHPLFAILPLLVREAHAERLELQPFEGATLQAYVENQYSLPGEDARTLASYLFKHTEGNPLFAAELLRAIENEMVLQERDGSWSLGNLEQVAPPALVVQMIERHLVALDRDTRHALEIAAVLGQQIIPEFWQQIANFDAKELDKALEQALAARLIEPDGITGLRFRHALIREVLYHGMSFMKRRQTHRRAAEMLMEMESSDPDTIASHLQVANDPRAVQWLIEAGHRAARVWAGLAGKERFEAALKLIESDYPMSDGRGWLLLSLATTSRDIAALEGIAYAEAAQQYAEETGDDLLSAWTLWTLGQNRFFAGENGLDEMAQGLTALRRLPHSSRDRLPPHYQRFELDYMDSSIIIMQSLFGQYRDALAAAEKYLDSVPTPTNTVQWHELAHAEAARAHALTALGDPEAASQAFRRTQVVYRKGCNAWYGALHATAELQYVALGYQADDLALRQRIAIEVESLWEEASGISTSIPPRFGLLPLLVVEGAWTEARELAAPFANRDVVFHHIGLSALGTIARAQGDRTLAWNLANLGVLAGPETEPGSVWILPVMELQRLASDLAIDDGNTDLACKWIQSYDRCLEWSGRVQGRAEAQILWARFYQASGDPEKALQYAEQALDSARDPRQPLALIAAYRTIGDLDVELGRYLHARENLQHSLNWAEACAAPYEQALTLLSLAELSATMGKPDDAWEKINRVRAICIPLGATPALDRAAAIVAKLSVQRGKSFHPSGLSPREVEVLELVACGLTDAEVADLLFISPRTVSTHLTSIYNKLGVSTRAAATRFAVEQGLVRPTSV